MAVRTSILPWLGFILSTSAIIGRAATLPIRAYTVADGLAHDHVSRIYRDSHGFLWICTDEGLSRFDGHQFVNYTVSQGLPHIHVNDILETSKGEYWIATDGGVALFRPAHASRKFLVYKPDGPPQSLFTNTLHAEPGGTLLAGTAAGLYRLHLNGHVRFERLDFGAPTDMPEGASVNSVYVGPQGTIWIAGVTGLYRREPDGTFTRYTSRDGLPHDFVDTIVADREGRIWVCTRHGLARLGMKPAPTKPVVDLTVSTNNGLPHRDVRQILFEADGRRWISTLGGLVEWLPGPPVPANFRIYSVEQGLTDKEVYAMASGSGDGSLWIGTRRGGLMRVGGAGFQTFTRSDGLAFSGSDALVETPSGSICVAANSDPQRAIRCFDGRRFRTATPILPPDMKTTVTASYHSTVVDYTGAWWLSSARGLFRLQKLRGTPVAFTAGPNLRLLAGLDSRRLFVDARRDLWISTLSRWTFGLMRWDSQRSRLESCSVPELVRQRGVTALAESHAGQLWIGLGRPGGLYRKRNGTFEEIPAAPQGTIQALFGDHSGRLWIASAEAGLGRMDNPSANHPAIRVYDRSQGLGSDEVWCVTEDRYGYIYVCTARGVDRLDPATDRITHYSSADGLAKGDIRAALRDRDGSLWFLSNTGLSRLRPGRDEQRPAPIARITAIRVAGTASPVSDLGEVNVSPIGSAWNRNSVQIEFSAIEFQSPEHLRYQFLLKGAPGGWSEPAADSSVHFSNLAPGRYEFRVRAISADGVAGAAPAYFPFTITPPPWRRWWFQTIAAAIALGLVYLGHKFRLERQLALERVRARIATDLHDDVGASLSRIAIVSEVVKERVSATDVDSRRMLSEVAETSRALVEGMSDIVWSIDPRCDNLSDVVGRLRAFGSDLLETRGIRWSCDGPSDALHHSLSPDQRRQFYLIFKEAIHNIARHSNAQNVVLRITVKHNRVRGEIQDDGRGATLGGSAGLGIASMRQRADRLGGKFTIAARPQGGLEASIEFRLNSRNA